MTEMQSSKWVILKYSRRKVTNAGRIVRKEQADNEKLDAAIEVIDNWRASHAYPLHVFYMYFRNKFSSRPDVLVVERMKRMESIIGKLQRETSMDLWMMQDLGGCRVILPTVQDVFDTAQSYRNSRIRHVLKNNYNYIENPKESGYRSFHLVYEYHSDKKGTYNRNMLIEIQLRTQLQHVWATAVEAMGILMRQSLKAGQGEPYIRRFFMLVSSLFALEEDCPVVPGTSKDKSVLIAELRELSDRYDLSKKILKKLKGFRVAIEHEKNTALDKHGYYVLRLNYSTNMLSINYFSPKNIKRANTMYTQIENAHFQEQIDAVLVQASSFDVLRKAYPNYFADIGEFVQRVETYLR